MSDLPGKVGQLVQLVNGTTLLLYKAALPRGPFL